jgi:hypothetical protein
MRDRGWRRYKEDVKVIRRLKNWRCSYWYRFKDVNDIRIYRCGWIDLIGDNTAHDAKSISTNRWSTRDKTKWGKKSKRSRYYDNSDPWTRHKDKLRFKKELDRIGLKHLPTNIDLSIELPYL